MTHIELKTLLETSGIPFAYFQWDRGNVPGLPFGVYYLPRSDYFYADNEIYTPIFELVIELYTKEKDLKSERELEAVLKENGLTYQKVEAYIEEEQVYQIRYDTEVIMNEE